ncbi:MAG: hypothetical protein IIB73_05335 [Proteobacteria bacterium]|nr:hypothetical protein [Pseudomonadota bacterium]
MTDFKAIISAEEEKLVQIFYKLRDDKTSQDKKLAALAKKLHLRADQIICAVGFNPNAQQLTEIIPILGFDTFEILAQKRNDIFTNDIYRRLTLDNMLNIYTVVKNSAEILQIMQYLLKKRLAKIEERIEETINSLIIEKYKAEMRAIYNGGIANIDFAEERLNKSDSGFRALLNEVGIIIESKLIPVGDIFFRDSILPEEKRKLLNKGLIPRELITSRLEDKTIPKEEKRILHEHLQLHHE